MQKVTVSLQTLSECLARTESNLRAKRKEKLLRRRQASWQREYLNRI